MRKKTKETDRADVILAWFGEMVDHCLEYAENAHASGHPVVGIMCEYAPREIIMAAGGVPVCLCGGFADTIPAAEQDLPAALCPLIKSTYGFHKTKENPFLEMADLLVAETTCDGKKKMFELMGLERSTYTLELPQKQDDPAAFEHWLAELRRFKEELERRFGVAITTRKLRTAVAAMNEERRLRRSLAELMKADAPPLTGCELLNLKSIIACLPADIAMFKEALSAFRKRQVKNAAKRPRVLLTGVPHPHGAEHVVELIEDSGGLVVCMENCTGLKPIVDEIDVNDADLLRAIARHYFSLPCSVMTPNTRRMDLLRRFAREYRAECVVEVVWQSCLTYDVESWLVRRLCEEELGLPYLKIVTDYSRADAPRLATRLEALFENFRGSLSAKFRL